MHLVFVIGTAGSGKSMLVGAYARWLEERKQHAVKVNLDPGAISLPYTPDVDVRDFVVVEDLMREHDLGPNGALVVAADLIATEVDRLKADIEALKPGYVLVDTPGQMELFAFRPSGSYIVKKISPSPKAVVYLFDSSFSSDPLNYASNLFLAAAVHSRFLLPQVYLLSKIDLLPREKVDEILDWSEDEELLQAAMEARLSDEKRILSQDIMQAVRRLGLTFELIPASARTLEGLLDLHAQLTRIFTGGEELL
jgi:hypothetical protein